MKVSELIEQSQAFGSDADVFLQVDSRMFAPPAWIGIMDTAELFDEEKHFELVISAWEPPAYLLRPEK